MENKIMNTVEEQVIEAAPEIVEKAAGWSISTVGFAGMLVGSFGLGVLAHMCWTKVKARKAADEEAAESKKGIFARFKKSKVGEVCEAVAEDVKEAFTEEE